LVPMRMTCQDRLDVGPTWVRPFAGPSHRFANRTEGSRLGKTMRRTTLNGNSGPTPRSVRILLPLRAIPVIESRRSPSRRMLRIPSSTRSAISRTQRPGRPAGLQHPQRALPRHARSNREKRTSPRHFVLTLRDRGRRAGYDRIYCIICAGPQPGVGGKDPEESRIHTWLPAAGCRRLKSYGVPEDDS